MCLCAKSDHAPKGRKQVSFVANASSLAKKVIYKFAQLWPNLRCWDFSGKLKISGESNCRKPVFRCFAGNLGARSIFSMRRVCPRHVFRVDCMKVHLCNYVFHAPSLSSSLSNLLLPEGGNLENTMIQNANNARA